MFKNLIKACISTVAEDYWNGWLYATEPAQTAPGNVGVQCAAVGDLKEISCSPDTEMQKQAWTAEPYRWVFGAWVGGELAAVCWLQARDAYVRHGGWFDLADNEAELVQITTAGVFRGRSIATQLIQYATWQMGNLGYRKIYAKIWRDNVASIRTFERAGWKRVIRFFSLRFRWRARPLIFRLPR